MTRIAVPINICDPYAGITTISGDTGTDGAGNGMSVDLSYAPNMALVVLNGDTVNDIVFTIELPAGHSTYNQAISIEHTVPKAVTNEDGCRIIHLDVPADLNQPGGLLHIDSTDGNFAGLVFYAVVWVI